MGRVERDIARDYPKGEAGRQLGDAVFVIDRLCRLIRHGALDVGLNVSS